MREIDRSAMLKLERRSVALWREELRGRARDAPQVVFASPPLSDFRRRVESAAETYDFAVRRLVFVRPRQSAPLLVVQTNDPCRFVERVPKLMLELNPVRAEIDGWQKTAYEGMFFEAVDGDAVPFLIAYEAARVDRVDGVVYGDYGMGGQWARAEDLYPFAHTWPVGGPSPTYECR